MNERAPSAAAHDAAVEAALERVSAAVWRALIRLDEHERRANDEQERRCARCGALFRPVPALDRLCAICQGWERTRAEERPPPRAGGGARTWP